MWFRSSEPWLLALLTLAAPVAAQGPERDYVVLIASEAVDVITRVRFGPGAGPALVKVETTTTIGVALENWTALTAPPCRRQPVLHVPTAHGVLMGT
jgi:hypothetical protein